MDTVERRQDGSATEGLAIALDDRSAVVASWAIFEALVTVAGLYVAMMAAVACGVKVPYVAAKVKGVWVGVVKVNDAGVEVVRGRPEEAGESADVVKGQVETCGLEGDVMKGVGVVAFVAAVAEKI